MPVESGDSGVGAAGTLNELIEIVRQSAGDHPVRDTLNGALDATQTGITFTTGTKIPDGALIEVDLEVMRVIAKASATAGTVVRNYYASGNVTHATGAEVITGFRHARQEYKRAINRALQAIGIAFGRPQWDSSQSFSSSKQIIEVPASATHVFDLSEKPTSYTDLCFVPFEYLPSVPTVIASSGKGVRLTGYNPGTGAAYIGYEKRWTALSALTDLLDAEYPTDAVDLIESGALAYLTDRESFERIAFKRPQALGDLTVQLASIRVDAREKLGAFLTRRTELAALYSRQNYTWIKG